MNYIKKIMGIGLLLAGVPLYSSECGTGACPISYTSMYKSSLGAKYTHPSFTDTRYKIETISAQELLAKIKNDPSLFVVNVLGQTFFDDAHITGSIDAPLRFLEEKAKAWDRNRETIVYCATKKCDASLKAFRLLKYLGFKNVRAYEGGIREWYRLGYPCEGPCQYAYLKQQGDFE
ncbi:MAG: rhodanese-like domain-containing protein [Candidatus Dependentiae bacterium]|nr:rhodanese-like domain-containing protein [Candidatus Dependentiae bacterium]